MLLITCICTRAKTKFSSQDGYDIIVKSDRLLVVLYCHDGACENGGTCIEGTDSYSCTCADGYTGATCSDGQLETLILWFCVMCPVEKFTVAHCDTWVLILGHLEISIQDELNYRKVNKKLIQC